MELKCQACGTLQIQLAGKSPKTCDFNTNMGTKEDHITCQCGANTPLDKENRT